MRKYLISVLIGIVIIIIIVALVNGIKIGDFQIKSIAMIKDDSDELESLIANVNQKEQVTYKSEIDNLEKKATELKKQKEDYADLILYNSDEENSNINLYENYEIEYLWTKLGNYATKNELIMKLEVMNSYTGAQKSYNLNFTLSGEYVSIIDCISEIEDDATLGFKIENFKLISQGGTLQATFTVQNVNINNIESVQNPANTVEQDENTNTTNNDNNTSNTVTTNNSVNNTANNTANNTVDNTL